MGALDRLMQFNAKSVGLTSDVFDVKTPEGAFFSLVHRHGFLACDLFSFCVFVLHVLL